MKKPSVTRYVDDVATGQTFSKLRPVFRLNRVTDCLETDGEFVDIHELVQSSKDIALNSILERFIPVEQGSEVVEADGLRDDLDFLREASQIAEDYKERYNLDSNADFASVFAAMSAKNLEILESRKKNVEKKEVKDGEKKGIFDEEKGVETSV